MNALRAYRLGIILSLLHIAPLPYKCFRNSKHAGLHLMGYQRGFTYGMEKYVMPYIEGNCT